MPKKQTNSKSRLSLNQLLSIDLQLNRRLKRTLSFLSLSQQQACILLTLREAHEPCSIESLRTATELSETQINLASVALQDRGHITRNTVRNDAGKRVITLKITQLGIIIIETAEDLQLSTPTELRPQELTIA